jgi:hypothetical protein
MPNDCTTDSHEKVNDMTDTKFPAPLENDPDDVIVALKSARSLFDAADYSQAARWLRKAASAAEEAGDDQRALDLAKKASDVESIPPPAALAAPAAPVAAGTNDPLYTQAIRVAVKRSVRDGDLFVARLLDNQSVPAGSYEAYLVLTNPNVDLFDPSAS